MMKKEKYIDSDGQVLTKNTLSDGTIWLEKKNGRSHRLDGPSRIWTDGTKTNKVNYIDWMGQL